MQCLSSAIRGDHCVSVGRAHGLVMSIKQIRGTRAEFCFCGMLGNLTAMRKLRQMQ
jgi:hypothetical protein